MTTQHTTARRPRFADVTVLFEQTQTDELPETSADNLVLSGVGSIAPKGLASPLLRDALSNVGITDFDIVPCNDMTDLVAQPDWTLALVLSPYKLDAVDVCDHVAPAARASGVVDTIVRGPDGKLYGVSTNAFGVVHAVRLLMAGATPRRILVLGTGGTSRCATVGLRQIYGAAMPIGVYGRSTHKAELVAEAVDATVVADTAAYGADLVLNCTTVGEVADEDLPAAFEAAIVGADRFFDLNNRVGGAQTTALRNGCVTISGNLMQRTVNALRAYLLVRKQSRND